MASSNFFDGIKFKAKPSPSRYHTMPPTSRLQIVEQSPLEAGTRFLETLWYAYASRIVDKAIAVYGLCQEKADELKQKFARRGDYRIVTN